MAGQVTYEPLAGKMFSIWLRNKLTCWYWLVK
jgi:hypothetical protein